MSEAGQRRYRGRFWAAVLLSVVAVVGGALVAYRGYAQAVGPQGVVRSYYAALARSDAPGALALGDLPAGTHTLLTSTVLREQQRIAPISGVQIVAVDQRGSTATVSVRYRLGFASGTRQETDSVALSRRGSTWRLANAAATTQLRVRQAADRAAIVGTAVPEGQTLLFPGAVPIAFDTPYLTLDPASASVRLASAAETDVNVRVADAARAAIRDAIAYDIAACVADGPKADPRCPQPSDRYVPGSLHGSTKGAPDRLTLTLDADPHGVIDVAGSVQFSGTYQELDFDNIAVAKSGTLTLPLTATVPAAAPVVVRWSAGS
jgi:hypothetical protein